MSPPAPRAPSPTEPSDDDPGDDPGRDDQHDDQHDGADRERHRPEPALTDLVAGHVADAGFVLDDLDVRPGGRRSRVRVTVDGVAVPGRDEGPVTGVDLDAVAALSRALSAALDEQDDDAGAAVPVGGYTLEVTTPGLDRPLTTLRHWRRAWLRRVVVTRADGAEVAGRVGGVTDDGEVTLAVPGRKGTVELHTLALGEVSRAVLDVEFKPAPQAEVDALREARAGEGADTGKDQT